jgi:uncharacterized membrane protein
MTDNVLARPALADSVAAVRRLADAELSLPARIGHLALLLVATMMTVVVGSLWLTEPQLPTRTAAAFAVMTTIGVLWMVYAVLVLIRRPILLARHQIVAGWMAVTFTTVFLVGTIAAIVMTGAPAAYAASATGALMLIVAIALLVRAQRTFATLAARRAALERERARTSR